MNGTYTGSIKGAFIRGDFDVTSFVRGAETIAVAVLIISVNPSHSTGRGGLANITDKKSPTHETSPPPYYPHSPAHQQEFFSSGRGGAGNIRSRSASRDVEKQQHHEHAHGHSHLHNLVEKAKHLA